MAEYIEREALRTKLDYELARWIDSAHDYKDDTSGMVAMQRAIYDVITAPAADVAPVVHGKWIRMQVSRNGEMHTLYACSNCNGFYGFREDIGERTFSENYLYCRRCGARMDGE